SGAAPQVDVQQASRVTNITRDVIDSLPVSRNVMSIGVLAPGVRASAPDIGGANMTGQVSLRAHGLSGVDGQQLVEGMSIQSANGVQHVQQFTGSVGGPLVKDKIWWIIAARHQSSDQRVANVPEHFLAPDGTPLRGIADNYVRGPSVRVSWQATQKNKLAMFGQRWWKRKGLDFAYPTDPRASTFRDPHHAHHFV